MRSVLASLTVASLFVLGCSPSPTAPIPHAALTPSLDCNGSNGNNGNNPPNTAGGCNNNNNGGNNNNPNNPPTTSSGN